MIVLTLRSAHINSTTAGPAVTMALQSKLEGTPSKYTITAASAGLTQRVSERKQHSAIPNAIKRCLEMVTFMSSTSTTIKSMHACSIDSFN